MRWLQMDAEVRNEIKWSALLTLGTEVAQPSSAAQCVAYLAAAELPHQQWAEVTTLLVNNITNVQSSVALKQATLEAIGYICEETDARYLAPHTNQILTAIIQGMRKEETNNRVKLVATRALLKALQLTRANFENETERHFIMPVLCEGTQCEDAEVKVAALQDLVKVMSLFYQYIETYMGPALFAVRQ